MIQASLSLEPQATAEHDGLRRSTPIPFDVALERGWSAEVNGFTVKNNLIELGPNSHDTAIATKLDYKRQ
jgi:hypothetical protein